MLSSGFHGSVFLEYESVLFFAEAFFFFSYIGERLKEEEEKGENKSKGEKRNLTRPYIVQLFMQELPSILILTILSPVNSLTFLLVTRLYFFF